MDPIVAHGSENRVLHFVESVISFVDPELPDLPNCFPNNRRDNEAGPTVQIIDACDRVMVYNQLQCECIVHIDPEREPLALRFECTRVYLRQPLHRSLEERVVFESFVVDAAIRYVSAKHPVKFAGLRAER